LERFFHRRVFSLLVLYVQHYWTLLKDDVCLCRNLQTMVRYDRRDYETLKKTIYLEARGESREGQIGVAWVIINRAIKRGMSIHDVCMQRHQFECWNDGMDTTIREHGAYASIDEWLPRVLDGSIPDNTGGADHYNNPAKENASWVHNVIPTVRIDNHQFYRSK
jgi:N-acetylmuramoyl-L-alanine amidase